MKKALLLVLAVICVSATASAAPIVISPVEIITPPSTPTQPVITATIDNLGGGNYAFNIRLDDQLNNTSAYFTGDTKGPLVFTGSGNILQSTFKASSVNDSATADLLDGVGGYNKALDTYYYSPPFGPLPPPFPNPAVTETANTFQLYLSGAGDDVPLARIVVAGTSLKVTGVVAREGGNFRFDGVFAVPEPATCAMLAIGAVLVGIPALRRRRGC